MRLCKSCPPSVSPWPRRRGPGPCTGCSLTQPESSGTGRSGGTVVGVTAVGSSLFQSVLVCLPARLWALPLAEPPSATSTQPSHCDFRRKVGGAGCREQGLLPLGAPFSPCRPRPHLPRVFRHLWRAGRKFWAQENQVKPAFGTAAVCRPGPHGQGSPAKEADL